MLDLSLLLSMQVDDVVNFAFSLWTSISISNAMYSLVLRVKTCCSSSVKWYLQKILVCGQKLPILDYDESEKVLMVGFLIITLLV